MIAQSRSFGNKIMLGVGLSSLIITGFLLYFRKRQPKKRLTSWIIKQRGVITEIHGEDIEELLTKDIRKLQCLFLSGNYSQQLVKQIIDFPFGGLTRLQLSFNLIDLYAPAAVLIALQQSYYTSKTPKKTYFQKYLLSAAVYDFSYSDNNPLMDISQISELNSEQLLFLWVQFFENDKPCKDDLRWFAKLQSNSVTRFHCNGDRRILQHKLFEVIKKKNRQIQIRHKGVR